MPGKATTTDEVLQVMRELDEAPVTTGAMLADEMDVTKPTALSYMNDLVDEEKAKKTTVGRTDVFWPADEQPLEVKVGQDTTATTEDTEAESSQDVEAVEADDLDEDSVGRADSAYLITSLLAGFLSMTGAFSTLLAYFTFGLAVATGVFIVQTVVFTVVLFAVHKALTTQPVRTARVVPTGTPDVD